MLARAINKVKHWVVEIKAARHQRRQEKLAQLAELEERERKALVTELTKKLSAAHVDCEQNKKRFANVELTVKEIAFVQGYLKTWSRYLKDHEIYKPLAQR
jgi:hypothetical protein